MAKSTAKKYGKKDEVKKLLMPDMLYFESANLLKNKGKTEKTIS